MKVKPVKIHQREENRCPHRKQENKKEISPITEASLAKTHSPKKLSNIERIHQQIHRLHISQIQGKQNNSIYIYIYIYTPLCFSKYLIVNSVFLVFELPTPRQLPPMSHPNRQKKFRLTASLPNWGFSQHNVGIKGADKSTSRGTIVVVTELKLLHTHMQMHAETYSTQ